MSAYAFRLATDAPGDRDAVRRLNHRTFALEIPQHAPTADGRLVDRFEAVSTTVVAEHRPPGLPDELPGEIVGMLSLASERPFSLDAKLPDLDAHLPPAARPCEVRLLAVDDAHRGGFVFRGLVAALASVALARGHDCALISGTTRQTRLYRHLGFEAFGPLVGTAEAPYQPMRLSREAFVRHAATFARERPVGVRSTASQAPVSAEPVPGDGQAGTSAPVLAPSARLLPGPVTLAPAVAAAMAAPLVSHREPAFVAALSDVRRRLCALTGAAEAYVLVGTGTLANDVVGAQLRARGGRGVVLAAGEFGERLADHARRSGLDAHVERRPWRHAVAAADVTDALDRAETDGAAPSWLWTPLCETSSGALLPLADVRAVCRARGVALALDAVSAIGSVDVDLRGVALASATSGKGLGGPPGLAIVLLDGPPRPTPDVPRTLDLGLYAAAGGVAFTHQSALVAALAAALDARADDAPARLAADAARLRARLAAAGFALTGPPETTSPAVTTVVLPPHQPSLDVADALAARGFEVSARSAYLVDANALQVCLMGAYPAASLDAFVDALVAVTGERAVGTA